MLERRHHRIALEQRLETTPVVALIGARQVGKTTIAQRIAADHAEAHYFDLERPADLARLAEPELSLGPLAGLVILDEIQRRPDLFPVLRGMIDRHPDRRFLILGSAAPELLRQSSETLAGRISYYDLPPLQLRELAATDIAPAGGPAPTGTIGDRLWIRGGFPRSVLAPDDETSFQWRLDFIRTFVERDLPSLGSSVPAQTHDRFWRMLAHAHGQVWNGARFASSFGVAATTVRSYLDLLTSALVVVQLRPWFENVGKRQVKSPKVYIADSGLLHALLDLADRTAIERHPILGASWEGHIINQLGAATQSRPDQRYFWATHGGAELDLLITRGTERIGFEVKRTTNPSSTKSLTSARQTLRLDRTYIIHGGEHSFWISPEVEAVAAADIATRTDW
jgi:predicted AAA+ superfamily ATPase